MDQTYELSDDVATSLFILYVLSAHEWIARRVESVECHDDSSARRRISVDFQIPSDVPRLNGRSLLPLALLRKGPLTNFDVRDESSRTLPVLTAEANGRVGQAIIANSARTAGLDPESVDVASLISTVAFGGHAEASAAAAQLKSMVLKPRDGLVQEFETIVDLFSRAFLLIVPLQGLSGQHRIVKLAYDEEFVVPKAVALIEGVRRALGWEGMPAEFETPAAGMCASYHFEVAAPGDVEITEGLLQLRTQVDGSGRRSLAPKLRRGGTPRIHLHTNLASGIENEGAVAHVTFRVARTWFSSSVQATVAIFLALFISVVMLNYLQRSGSTVQTEAVVSLLVVLPGVIGAIVTRPPDHAIAARMLRGPRALVLCVGGLAYIAAWVFLAIGGDQASWIWEDLTIAAGLGSVLIVTSLRYPRVRSVDDALNPTA